MIHQQNISLPPHQEEPVLRKTWLPDSILYKTSHSWTWCTLWNCLKSPSKKLFPCELETEMDIIYSSDKGALICKLNNAGLCQFSPPLAACSIVMFWGFWSSYLVQTRQELLAKWIWWHYIQSNFNHNETDRFHYRDWCHDGLLSPI